MQNHLVVKSSRAMSAIACVLAAFLCPPAHAEAIYSFVDEHGVVHLSNVPNAPRYRIATVVTPSTPQEPGAPPQTTPQGEPQADEAPPPVAERPRFRSLVINAQQSDR